MEKERMQDADAKSRRGIGTRRMERRGENNTKRRHLLTVQFFAARFKMKIVQTLLLHTGLTKCACLLPELFGVLLHPKREPGPAASPLSTTLHSTVNTSVKKEVDHSNTHGIVRLCYFSRWITAAHSLHFQHLMWTKGYEFKTSTVKRSLVSIVHSNI